MEPIGGYPIGLIPVLSAEIDSVLVVAILAVHLAGQRQYSSIAALIYLLAVAAFQLGLV